jgi:4-hydroxy-4-methyl-2-oxoglutarate aldolase
MDQNVQRASKLDTTALSDALDRLGIPGQCLGIKPLDSGFRLAGRAFTLLYVPEGNVIVIDNGGRENATVWGDILTMVAHRRNIPGTVIDGACRDTNLSREIGYPIFSRSYSMRTGKDRVQLEGINGPVNIGDARVLPGDILRGDGDGVVVIPQAHEERLLTIAEEIDGTEEKIRQAVLEGMRLTDARKQYGYHQLQTKKP